MGKKDEYRFNLRFDETDEMHRLVVKYLNSCGHNKAKYIVRAFLAYTAFRNWCMQRAEEKLEIPTYTNCTICFVHVYDETLPLARVRDHDNYEEKHVQDIITNFFLRSDSGLYTNTCHVTRMGEEDRTLLYVMDSSKFPAWISDFGKETGIEKNHE